MIVVTGASGNVGTHVVSQLAAAGFPVRALSRKPAAAPSLRGVEWVEADFEQPESLARALQGATRVVLISPAHPRMRQHQVAVVDAAVAAGARRIAKLSGLGAGPQAPIRLPQEHYAIEQHIERSGLAHSFVRPNLFMQVLLGSADSIAGDGVIYAPAGEGAISFIDARDVAAVLVHEVLRDDVAPSVREITGPEALTYAQAAETIGGALRKAVRFVSVEPAAARDGMLSSGMDPWLVEAFLELFEIYRAGHGAAVLAAAVESALGRPALTLARFAADHAHAFQRAA
ncbi:NAD(P)H-binding protein [uncultured Azohydromonas sp.]|jgi:Predicted nucleoside-diphosphate-sugar epimerases|uniref:NAD(P)H-binding protein n=1 Tax=uncultured Azohydromonas sp. TaxID=487342 RepID=UPI002625A1A7|nr:NAD(P)H-binding protein [uncultured Azohydromonas sp.]